MEKLHDFWDYGTDLLRREKRKLDKTLKEIVDSIFKREKNPTRRAALIYLISHICDHLARDEVVKRMGKERDRIFKQSREWKAIEEARKKSKEER